jgi:hypothetical protein
MINFCTYLIDQIIVVIIGIFIISANSGDELSINNPLGALQFLLNGQIIIKQL